MLIREILGYRSVVDMNSPVVAVPLRKMSYRFMAGEAWWILAGRNDVPGIVQFNPVMTRFTDNGDTFFGAYGPPLLEQRSYVVNTLANDQDSRQAVATIWRQRPPISKDIPCTVALQWLIRDGKLNCVATMRSSDAWLGWVYDVFNFSMLTLSVLLELRGVYELGLGNLYLNAGSQHLYESNVIVASHCMQAPVMEIAPLMIDENICLTQELFEFASKNLQSVSWPWLRVLASQVYAEPQQ